MANAEAIAEIRAELEAQEAADTQAAAEAAPDTSGAPPPAEPGDASPAASVPAVVEDPDAPKPAELASPRIAAAIKSEVRAQRERKAAERERDAAQAEAKQIRSQLRQEMEQHRQVMAEYSAELEHARKLRSDPTKYVEELRDAGDPQVQERKRVEALEKWKADQEAANADTKKREQHQAIEREVGATVQSVLTVFSSDEAAKVMPSFNLPNFTPRMRAKAVERAIRSGQYSTIDEIASKLESDAAELAAEMKLTLQPAAVTGQSAQANEQQSAGSGTQAAKPQGSTKTLTRDLSAETTADPTPLTRDQRIAQLKADLAREERARKSARAS